ncbi:MAG TPA: hypothetical protein VHF89_18105 [Solirubrobacteraceae bacterium]|nr:hypothetical protein [Solirubrobacteraceae bacterium]
MNDRLRVDDRGLAAGIGAALLAVTVFLTLARFDDKWGTGVQLVISALAAAAALAYAIRSSDEDEGRAGPVADATTSATGAPGAGGPGGYVGMISRRVPAGWTSSALVAGFALTTIALFFLADVLGANSDDPHESTITWIALVLVVLFVALSARTGSAVCLLLAAIAFVVMVIAAVQWIFSPDDPAKTWRWFFLILAVVLFAAGVITRDQRPRHGTVLVVVAGLTTLAMAVTLAPGILAAGDPTDAGATPGWGWELVILLFGVALTAYAIFTREPGPGYVGGLVFLAFVLLAVNSGDEPSLIGWPIVLVILTGLAIAAGLRPGGGPSAPAPATAATAPREDPGDTTREVRL